MNKILIAEDESAIANLIRAALDGPDYRCTWAANGLAACDLLEREPFDLVLLDIMLPGADGYQVLDYCRALEVPVTAKGTVEDRVKGLRLGAEDYITKPFELMELLARVETVLRRCGKTGRVLSLPPDIEIDTAARTVCRGGVPVALTAKEYELLLLFVQNKNIALYRDRIYEKVWWDEYLGDSLDQAVQERLIPYNPAAGCKLPPKEKKEMHTLPVEKISAYLAAAEEHGVLPMFYLELTTGLRRGELVALLWDDLDLEAQTLTISKSAGRINGEVKVTQPKTANSVRTIYLPQETIDLLIREHSKHPGNPIMFPSPVTGRLYGPDCIGRLHKTLLKKAGITENIPFHGLRHTFATSAIQQGVDAKTVSSILGHYSAGFTLDTYTHVTGEMQKDAAQRMGSFIAQAV